MKITAENVLDLKPQAQIKLLQKIIDGAKKLDNKNPECEAITFILFSIIDSLDSDNDGDQFGTEGWRHSILGED